MVILSMGFNQLNRMLSPSCFLGGSNKDCHILRLGHIVFTVNGLNETVASGQNVGLADDGADRPERKGGGETGIVCQIT